MSWIMKLAQTYDNCLDKVGIPDDDGNMLLPISHSTQNAQIEITLDMNGKMLDAQRVVKDEAETVIPVTEDSAVRSSGIAAHPLADKLIYVAGDYSAHVKGDGKKTDDYHTAYIEGLSAWAGSEYGNERVRAVYDYVSKSELISDLIEKNVLIADDRGMLSDKEKINGISQTDSFVRFRVEDVGNPYDESALWKLGFMYEDFQKYYRKSFKPNGICYATGEERYCTDKHSGKIRHGADKSKIISANDASGFTYRGRFVSKEEANNVSYEVSQKAHNALKWIIQRENLRFDEMVMIVFRVKNGAILDVINNITSRRGLFDSLGDEDSDSGLDNSVSDNGEMYAKQLKKSIYARGADLSDDEDVLVMTLEAATTGRLSITYYREMSGSHYKDSVEHWKNGCRWYYRDYNSGKIMDWIPSLEAIIRCAYGVEQGGLVKVKDKLNKMSMSRLIPCVIDGKSIPADIVNRSVLNVSKPDSYSSNNWKRMLKDACAIIHKYYIEKGEEYMMELENRTERDYLYGRLLAIADAVEGVAMKSHGVDRITNAQRYMTAFQKHPNTTWVLLRNYIQPYLNRLKAGQRLSYMNLINDVTNLFEGDDFMKNDSLGGAYLLGYSNQREALYRTNDKSDSDNN